ncbi:protein-glutamate O-methyltransferase CheR [Methanoregula sp.]|uniref:CheR family methyltransferase n=1 Tax=Methanoregula sp. TaxID=2052170 RepID=UPI002CD0A404|nr:protein-glutamate O-methyltransferase CheR [Methanoregula sp.]HVP95927.1 protein-glutamate O-methyltransferase CheR [Methanoregula sp.]
MTPEKDDGFGALKRYIEQNLKIQCSNYKEDYIKRRLLSRMRSTNTSAYDEYLKYLREHEPEHDVLRKALTINVTEFFRDTDVYDLIRKEIFPALFKGRKTIRIWCAGCSTGEEPYSLAMILSDMMAADKSISGQIFATDIDEVVLKKAKDGIYSEKSMGKLSETQMHRHFTKLADGTYQVKPHLQSLIRFRPHDLMSGQPISRFLDMISCRNVTIYFTEKQKDELAKTFYTALVPGGYYVMGKTEYLGREVEGLFIPVNSIQKIYRKKE